MSSHIWLTLASAFGLACSALLGKILLRYRLCDAGLITWGTWTSAGVLSAVVWAFTRPAFPTGAAAAVVTLAVCLLLASWLQNVALQEGDPSLVVPVTGVKIPMAALLAWPILGERYPPAVYGAVVLSALATVAFGLGKQEQAQGGHGRRPIFALGMITCASLGFALGDQFARLSLAETSPLGVALWAPMIAGGLSLPFLFHPHYRQYRIERVDVLLLLLNAGILVGSILALYLAFRGAGGVTVPNVILGARGFFVLVAGAVVGRALPVPFERQRWSVYAFRAVGTAFFLGAIALVSLSTAD